jgi:hypothetical protein
MQILTNNNVDAKNHIEKDIKFNDSYISYSLGGNPVAQDFMKKFLITLFNSKFRTKTILEHTKPILEHFGNCPINEQTADGYVVGQCCFSLDEELTCPRHGDVSFETKEFNKNGTLTIESKQRNLINE